MCGCRNTIVGTQCRSNVRLVDSKLLKSFQLNGRKFPCTFVGGNQTIEESLKLYVNNIINNIVSMHIMINNTNAAIVGLIQRGWIGVASHPPSLLFLCNIVLKMSTIINQPPPLH